MFSKIPERYMHLIRSVLTGGWLMLIASMFYDPISAELTKPNSVFGPRIINTCVQFQGECLQLSPYPIGARIWWGIIIPIAIIMLLLVGHEGWRRMCPLSFMSQLPRALGWQGKRLVSEKSWLGRNYLYLQFGLLWLGLNIRLLLVNSDRLLLGIFLLLSIGAAITVGFLYEGKSWCQYFCPFAPVQEIFTGTGGLLGSEAHKDEGQIITQSMCRTVDKAGNEHSACVGCKLACIDIDVEGAHWYRINQPDRKLLFYAYLGLVIGFYLYFWLYSGNWNFLSAGVWNETNQLATLMKPGLYISGKAIAIPKLIAVPLTLSIFSATTYTAGLWLEKAYKRYNKRFKHPLSVEHIQNRAFAIAAFLGFNFLYFLGVRPTLGYLPLPIQNILSWLAILVSTLWFLKNWRRSAEQYACERDANSLRRQLKQLNIDFSQFLNHRSVDELTPEQLYALAKVLPSATQQDRLQVYTGILLEALEQGMVKASSSLNFFKILRKGLNLTDDDHRTVLAQLQISNQELFVSTKDSTKVRTGTKTSSKNDLTKVRPDRKSFKE